MRVLSSSVSYAISEASIMKRWLPILVLVGLLLVIASVPVPEVHAEGISSMCLSYTLFGGGDGFGQPVVSYTLANETQVHGVPSSGSYCFHADTGTEYEVTNPLVGSTSDQRAIADANTSGMVSNSTLELRYYTQYFVYFKYTLGYTGTTEDVPALTWSSFGRSVTANLNLTSTAIWIDGLTLWNATNPFIIHPELVAYDAVPSGRLAVGADSMTINYQTVSGLCSSSPVTNLINGCEFFGAAQPYFSLLGQDFVIGFIAISISIALYLDTKSGLLALTPLIAGLAVFGDTLPVELQLFIYLAAAIAITAVLFKVLWSRS